MVNIGFYNNGIGFTFDDMRRLWQQADELGYDSAWTMDNSVAPILGHRQTPVFEPYMILPALAEATKKIRFGPLCTPCGRRHPAVLAKMTSVLDVISGGRLELAMGAGDHPDFFRPWGIPYPDKPSDRIAILREEIQVIKLMWTEERASFNGRYYTLTEAFNSPKPLQKPHPRIWLCVQKGRKLLPRLVAELADGVNTYVADDAGAEEILRAVEGYCAEFGRDFGEIEKSRHMQVTLTDGPYDHREMVDIQARREGVPSVYLDSYWMNYPIYTRHLIGSPTTVAEELRKQTSLGFNHLLLQFRGVNHPLGGGADEVIATLQRFAVEVMPQVRAS